MLKMPQQQYIKFLREIEGCNIQQIAEAVKVDWRTAKKYADRDDWNIRLTKRNQVLPVLEPYREIIDTWLMEDRLVPRKQRHTAARIFQRLRDEHQFTGSSRTVSSYVRKQKIEIELERAKSYERLEHPGGEAQVDFCTIQVSRDSQLQEYKLLIMSFPFSNAAFVHPEPAENQECFLEGLKTLFHKAGGVPTRIWFDNLSAAVAIIGKEGERRVHDLFARFSTHYRFEAVFCNPSKGNEKGNVENKCGYSRRNWCVPIPQFESHEKLALELDQLADEDIGRIHYSKELRIRELWEQEKVILNQLPDTEFDIFRLGSGVINKYSEVQIDKTSVAVFGANPGNEVLLRLWWDRVDVLNQNYKILTSIPRPYVGKIHEIPWVEVFKGFRRKPRSVRYSQFVRFLPTVLRDYLCIEDLCERKERILAAINWCSIYSVTDVANAIEKLETNSTIPMITNVLALAARHGTQESFQESYTPEPIRGAVPDLSLYNTLTKGGENG